MSSKLQNLPATTTLAASDILYTVTTPGATPTDNKITQANLEAGLSVANMTGTLSVPHGGTGAVTLTGLVKGNGTSAMTAVTAPSGAVVGDTDSQTLTNKTLTAPIIATISNTGTLTLPSSTDTLVGRATTDTLTNKTITTPTISKPVMSATNPTAQTYSPAGGGTSTLDLSLSNQHYVTFPAGNITIALSNDTNNQIFLVSLTQDSGGSRTVTWFTTIKWTGGTTPTLTTTANKRDTFGFIRTGSGTYDGFIIGQNI